MKKNLYETAAAASIRWILFGAVCGLVIGCASGVFGLCVVKATALRNAHNWLICCMPAAGLVIAGLYHLAGTHMHHGTDLVIEAIHDKEPMEPLMAPLIFVSTVLTHLTGGSSGREGAALQIGGSMGSTLAGLLKKFLHFNESDHGRVVMTGMAAAFSALFGTPIAAVLFSLELSTVGILQYSALLPCTVSSLVADRVARSMGLPGESLPLKEVPVFDFHGAFQVIVLAVLCALISIVFCEAIHKTDGFFHQYISNDFVRTLAVSAILIVLSVLTHGQMYNGTGAHLIEEAVMEKEFDVSWYFFLLKILFTALTISGGYKGGEIVPSFFIGAMFGRWIGPLLGMNPMFAAAIGLGCMFCGITNCPTASVLMCFELFGFEGGKYFLLAMAVTYLFSGNFSIYHSQIIHHRKSGIEA